MAFCINCGSQVPDGAKFCANCGTPVASIPAPAPAPVPEPIPEPIPEPVVAPAPEPIPEPIPEPVAAPVPEPIPEPVATPIPEPVAAPMHFEQVQSADVDDDLNMEGPPIVGNYTIPGMENVPQQTYTAPVVQPQAPQPQATQPAGGQYAPQPQATQYVPQPQAAPSGKAPKAPKAPKQPSEGGSKFGRIMMFAVGGLIALTILLSIVMLIVNAVTGGSSSKSKKGGAGEGTALTELLDRAAATHYGGGSSDLSSNIVVSNDIDKEDSDDSDSAGTASAGVVGPGGDESKKISNQFVGSYERNENDHMIIDVPEGWFGMEGGIDGKYSGYNESAGNGPNGTVDAFVYYDRNYTDAILEDQMNTTKQIRFETTVDIDDIEIDGITLKGFEGIEETLGKKVLTRLYMGIKDGKALMIEFKTNDLDGAVFREPAPWNMIYSVKVK